MKPQTFSLAEKIAEDIFKAGDISNNPCQRIEFKGGKPTDESNNGGVCKEALVLIIENSLGNIKKS